MFRIIGGDGRQYGPVTVEEAREWIKGGRANAQTQAQKEGEADWKPMSAFPEFIDALAALPAQPVPGPSSSVPQLPPAMGPTPGPTDPAAIANEVLACGGQVDVGSCLGRAWDHLKSDFWPIIGTSAVVLLLLLVANGAYVGIVINGPLIGGLFWYFLKRLRQQLAQINDAFAGFQLAFVQLFLGALVSSLLTGVGLMACIIPGIYLAVAWYLTLPIIIDRRIGFWEAMEVSRRVLTKHWWNVFLFAIVCGVINFCGVLLCGIGLFVTFPLTVLATTFLYEDLFGTTKAITG